jgi:hypothetical protein
VSRVQILGGFPLPPTCRFPSDRTSTRSAEPDRATHQRLAQLAAEIRCPSGVLRLGRHRERLEPSALRYRQVYPQRGPSRVVDRQADGLANPPDRGSPCRRFCRCPMSHRTPSCECPGGDQASRINRVSGQREVCGEVRLDHRHAPIWGMGEGRLEPSRPDAFCSSRRSRRIHTDVRARA